MLHTRQDLNCAKEYVQRSTALQNAIGLQDGTTFELSYLGAGEHNFNYVLRAGNMLQDDCGGKLKIARNATESSNDRIFVLRVNVVPQAFHKDQISYEYAALKAIEASGCTPRVYYMDNSAAAPKDGVLVMEFCDGDELNFDHLRPGDLRCAAQLMANIHATPVDPACTLHRPCDPLDDLWAESMERFDAYRASGAEDPRITKWVDRFCTVTREAMDTAGAPDKREYIVHTETLPSHFLIPASSAQAAAANTNKTGAFCPNPGYMIDWERPVIAEPAQDVAYFTGPTMTFWDSEFMFPARDVQAFVEDYWRAVDGRFARGNFDERFAVYRMLTTLRSVGWCCKRLGMYGSLETIDDEKTARKLPVYLSDDFNEMLAADVFGL